MAQFTPWPVYWDEAPVDISFVFSREKPAGQHGFLQVAGDRFTFEDGTTGLFWGTTSTAAHFPDFDYSEKTDPAPFTHRVNVFFASTSSTPVATPNIFQLARSASARPAAWTREHEASRLSSMLKQEGIYCYLDLMTSASSNPAMECPTPSVSAIPPSLQHFFPRLIDLQKELSAAVNTSPVHGLAWKDDPVFILSEITNECDLFNSNFNFDVEPYHSELVARLCGWLEAEGLSYPAENATFKEQDAVMLRFKMAVQESYYRELIAFMRDLGVKIPITGTNWKHQRGQCPDAEGDGF